MKAKKQPSGNWKVRVYDYTDEKGKKHYRAFTAPSKKEAELLAAEFSNGKKVSENRDMTLRNAYDKYFEIKSNVLSPTTLRSYKGYSRNALQDLMPCKLSSLTQAKIQKSINSYAVSHSPKSVRNVHGLLSAVLTLFDVPIKLNTSLPQRIKKTPLLPSEAEIKAMLSMSEGTDLERAILLGAYGTLRRSEVCALTKQDITANGIIVSKAFVENGQKEFVLKTTKTTESSRFVPLPENILERLKLAPTDRIVNITPNAVSSAFKRLSIKTCGKPYNFHLTRHFAATLYHSAGVSDHWIMEHGGWSNTATLHNIYVGSISEEEERQQYLAFSKIKSMTENMA